MPNQLSPEKIAQLGLSFWGSKTLLSAIELGLFTELAKGPLDTAEIRRRLALHERSARDFLDALVALGMLERDEQQRYRNTPETDLFLDRAKPTYAGGMLEMANARLFTFWGSLTEGLRTGEPQNEAKTGGDLFDAIYSDPDRLECFLEGMTGISLGAVAVIAEKFPWKNYKTVIDIGCAQGALPVKVALTHPHLTGGGYDLPVVRPPFEKYGASHGLTQRLKFYCGSFFTDPLPTADVLVMGHILHDWNWKRKRCYCARRMTPCPRTARSLFTKPSSTMSAARMRSACS